MYNINMLFIFQCIKENLKEEICIYLESHSAQYYLLHQSAFQQRDSLLEEDEPESQSLERIKFKVQDS